MPVTILPKTKDAQDTTPDFDSLARALLSETAPAGATPAAAGPAGDPGAAPQPQARPALSGFVSPIDEDRYTCEGNEALRILRDVARDTTQAQILFDHGRQVLISAVLDVLPESDELILDYGGVESLNQALMRFNKFIIITQKDRCKVQFSVDRIERTKHDGRDAFTAPLPERLVWLQRREFFRVRIPLGKPLKCWFQMGGERIEAEVLDVSLDGVGLLVHDMSPRLEEGMTLKGATLGLAGSVPVGSDLNVRYILERTGPHNKPCLRVGCRFVNLPGDAMRELQRYMNAVERERRMKERGDL